MKLRALLKKLRPALLQAWRPLDGKDDEAATFIAPGVGDTAPINWVPSQQDERPRH